MPLAPSARKREEVCRLVSAAYDGLVVMVRTAGSRDLTLEDLLRAHRTLMEGDPTEAPDAGRLRTVQNWIGGPPGYPVGALHIPPRPERVEELMDDLIGFLARDDLDPLIQSAVAHAQFESIHRLTDGNGRIGRTLMNAVWRSRGATRTVSLPIAAALAAQRARYFSALDQYREGDIDGITTIVAQCAVEAGDASLASSRRLASLPAQWRDRTGVRSGSAAARLIDRLLDRPVVDVEDVKSLTGASTAAAYRALEGLEESGVLRRLSASRRDVLWGAGDVLDEADHLIADLEARSHGR